jgi:23S rRNA (uracil1939-C5)-methyltransferase
MSSEGLGVARIDGRAVFVAGALPGETCKIKLLKVTKTAVYAKLDRLTEPSAHRIKPECPYFEKCGGCDFLHCTYEEELRIKTDRVNDALKRIGGLSLSVTGILSAPGRLRYRNKAIFAVGQGKSGVQTGFFRPRSHELVPVDSCLIQSAEADAAAETVRDWMNRFRISCYDEAAGRGLVRNIFVRTAYATGMVAVTLVVSGEISHQDELIRMLRSRLPEIKSIVLNINKSRGNTLLSGSFFTLWGNDFIEDELCGLRFKLSPRSFFQVHNRQAEELYNKALEYAGLTGTEQVLDLYCGTGTIGLCAASKAEKVMGVEVIEDAVSDAKENAARNKITNAEFLCADAAAVADSLKARGFHPDVVFVDPPRKGLAADVINIVSELSPEKIVYISCDPATLARDLKLFQEKGYAAISAAAVDMFPGTVHVETVVLITRNI